MTAPGIAAARFLWGVVLGLGLGLLYGFLRPLRRRHLADALFLIGAFPVWLYFCFGVCRGGFHLGYLSGLFIGGILFHCTLGRLLQPVWKGFWGMIGRFFLVLKSFFRKITCFLKKIIASKKKKCTIE